MNKQPSTTIGSLLDKAALPKVSDSAALPPSHAPIPENKTLLSLEDQEKIKTFMTDRFQAPITERVGKNSIVFTMPALQWVVVGLITGKNDPQAQKCAGIVSDHPELLDEFGYVTLQRNTDFRSRRFVWLIPTKATVKELRKRRADEERRRANG
jgi:hypothetical protein